MDNKIIAIIAVIIVLAVGAFALTSGKDDKQASNTTNQSQTTNEQEKQPDTSEEAVTKPASFAEGYEKVKVGMTQQQVATLLGEPMGECKTNKIPQLDTTMTTCNYRDPASANPEGLADVTVDFDEDLKVMQKQKY